MTRFLVNIFATLLLLTSLSALAATAQVRGEFASANDANALKGALSKSFGSEVKFSYPGENPAAGDGANFDNTGWAVAVAGDTALVGVPLDSIGANEFQGTVYVYLRTGSSWSQQAKLKASDGAGADEFGFSVALSADTALIGAVAGNSGRGAAYVFTRSATVWTQQARLVATDAGANDRFGWSVALEGDRAVVGANQDDLANANQGSAYVFSRSGNVWSQQSKLTAADGGLNDEFGLAVAVSGTTILVGARTDGSTTGYAYVYIFSAGAWTQQAKITATDAAVGDYFGWSVALEGDTALIGAPGDDIGSAFEQGSAYVFVRSGLLWTQQAKLVAADGAGNDQFAWKVALSGDTALIGAHFDSVGSVLKQGSAYAFTRSGALWSQQAKLVAADGLRDDEFGYGLAIAADTAIIGAPFDDVGGNTDQGSAYAFTRSGTAWSQQNQFSTGAGSSDQQFALAIAVSGDTAMAGARLETVGSKLRQGAVYVYTRSANVWTQSARLLAVDGDVGDNFGNDVAINGDTAVIGASGDTLGTSTLQGSAYVFVRSGGVWSQQSKLIAADGSSGMEFGRVVAVDADTVLIGAPSARIGANFNQGAAYIYVRNGTSWSLQSKLSASDGVSGDYYGLAVALSGNNALVASSYDDIAANSDQGSVYAYTRSGVAWNELSKLIAADGAAGDYFGVALAMSGDTAIVGAFFDDVGSNANQGSAYVYTLSAGSWSLQSKLLANDGVANDGFGLGVALAGNIAVIGARQRDLGSNSDQGTAYVFTRSGNSWSQQRRFAAGDGATRDYYGYSVAISGDVIAVGAYAVDSVLPFGNPDIGALYLYRNDYTVTPLANANATISPNAPQTVLPNQTLNFSVAANMGYSIGNVVGCGGSWTGSNPYVTGPIVSDCNITVSTIPNNYSVTPSAGANGSISPSTPVTVSHGMTTSFIVMPSVGYTALVSGSCGGTLNGTIYTTNAVTGNCTVIASFTLNSYTVTPSAGANGSISPSTPVSVNHGSSTSFSVAANSNYTAIVGGSCGGTMNGTIYTTNAVTSSCSVSASFVLTSSLNADLSISKTNFSNFVNGAVAVEYLITVSNAGPANVIGARVQDQIGAGTDFTAATWTCSGSNGASCAQGSGTGALNLLLDMPAQASVQIAFRATLTQGQETPISNLASVAPPALNADPNLTNNVATDGPDLRGIFRNGFE